MIHSTSYSLFYSLSCFFLLFILSYAVFFFFFFFQAEDGIRDLIVTGVQTCALPISTTASPVLGCFQATATMAVIGRSIRKRFGTRVRKRPNERVSRKTFIPTLFEIGRASCRERV